MHTKIWKKNFIHLVPFTQGVAVAVVGGGDVCSFNLLIPGPTLGLKLVRMRFWISSGKSLQTSKIFDDFCCTFFNFAWEKSESQALTESKWANIS